MTTKTYVGDIGTIIVLRVLDAAALAAGLTIADATTREINVRKPDGTITTWTATAEGTDSIQYTTIAGDLATAGEYHLQAHVVLPTWNGRGETDSLTVNLPFA